MENVIRNTFEILIPTSDSCQIERKWQETDRFDSLDADPQELKRAIVSCKPMLIDVRQPYCDLTKSL